ncbi:MOSC domain-containing protein [Mariniphaga sediminis]|uniref:Molybdopterin adenylyltransferase n=1 Tax=Mariniphaga sediminis TaxID=1628158 RepID=A0A399D5X6_9BACT|nr:MOSC domain-containing protein [Mariniphaga sediminis]RIH66608.1 MOSC domain-containing protein [Mariniphaga sediminis]
MIQVTIKSLNLSEKKGTVKTPVGSVEITETGVKDDAHAGHWHRQVSLLGTESLKKAEEQNNRTFQYGDFGENITTEGLELYKANILDRFQAGNVILEVTQIGKKCHKGCEIMKISGNCIMPVEGIFCRVIQPGELRVNDVLQYIPRQIKIAVITLSDRAYKGIYEDKSGPYVTKMLNDFFGEANRPVTVEQILIPDDETMLENELNRAVENEADIIVTTGGTGIGSRDITPDVVKRLLDKEIPGIMELIRYKYGSVKPNALLSRSIAGVKGKSLIYVLPGSVKAVNEYLTEIIPTLNHSIRMVNDVDVH